MADLIEDEDGAPLSRGTLDVISERSRQIRDEEFTPEHDNAHDGGDLASAGACYAINAACVLHPANGTPIDDIQDCAVAWPWDKSWWKPSTPRRDLVKAAALLLAEIDRIDSGGQPS